MAVVSVLWVRYCCLCIVRNRGNAVSEEAQMESEHSDVAAGDEGSLTQTEMAKKFRVKVDLVHQLVKEAEKKPEKLRNLKQREKDVQYVNQAVEQVAAGLLERSIPIEKAAKV